MSEILSGLEDLMEVASLRNRSRAVVERARQETPRGGRLQSFTSNLASVALAARVYLTLSGAMHMDPLDLNRQQEQAQYIKGTTAQFDEEDQQSSSVEQSISGDPPKETRPQLEPRVDSNDEHNQGNDQANMDAKP